MVEKLEKITEQDKDTKALVGKVKKAYDNKLLNNELLRATKGLPFAKAYKYRKKKSYEKGISDYSPCVNEPPCVMGN